MPLLSKGSLVIFFGGPEVIVQVANNKPSPVVLIFFIYSILIQIVVLLYKKIRKYQLRSFQTYIQELRTNLGRFHHHSSYTHKIHCVVNNVVNMYGTMVLITITGVSTFIIVSHYRDILQLGHGGEKVTKSMLVPKEWFYLIGLTTVCVFLPFVKSHALRFELCHPKDSTVYRKNSRIYSMKKVLDRVYEYKYNLFGNSKASSDCIILLLLFCQD